MKRNTKLDFTDFGIKNVGACVTQPLQSKFSIRK
jgi:hypothetical protein